MGSSIKIFLVLNERLNGREANYKAKSLIVMPSNGLFVHIRTLINCQAGRQNGSNSEPKG